MDIVKNFFVGIAVGVANVIPGVSGGTMAVVFGVYDRIISSVINFFKDIKKNIIFLGSLGIGAVAGILIFANLIKWCLNNFHQQTNFFFMGLIVGTIPLIYKKSTQTKVNKLNILWCVIAFLIAFIMAWGGKPEVAGSNIITTLSAVNIVKMFFGGFIAAAAMILPGISGSFILLMLGLYDSVIIAVTDFNIPILIVLAIGILIGFLSMTKIIDILFKKFPQTAYFIILGLIIGSIYAIFPGITFSIGMIISIIVFVVGFIVAYKLGDNK